MKNLLILLVVFLGINSSAQKLEHDFSGYIDAGYHFNENLDYSTFEVFQGAIRAKVKYWDSFAVVDLAFSGAGNIQADGSSDNQFSFLKNKAQFYLGYQNVSGFHWWLGQFDRFYGLDKSDSDRHQFSLDDPVLRQFSLPASHLGFLAGYDLSPVISLRFLMANHLGLSRNQNGKGNPDLGLYIRVKTAKLEVLLNTLLFKFATGDSYGGMANIQLLTQFNSFELGFLSLIYQSGQQQEKTQIGVGMKAVVDLSESLKWNLRVNYGNNLSDVDGRWELVVQTGPSYQLNGSLKLKLNYNYYLERPTRTASKVDNHEILANALFSF